MNSLIVISWVAMGFFAAWIGTHLFKVHHQNGGVANLAVGVLGALLGGLLMHSFMHGRQSYFTFIVCAGASLLVSASLIGLTSLAPHRRVDSKVS
jgi:uncharacterized membrane protein YeaQ/YmgE (transglycosylase-associated protein family)